MGLFEKLKTLFGLGDRSSSRTEPTGTTVTEERTPDAASEHAVKGTRPREPVEAEEKSGGEERKEEGAKHEESEGEEREAKDEDAEDEGAEDEALEEEAEGKAHEPEKRAVDDEKDVEEAKEASETDSVTEIDGIGPTYTERLEEAGIETVAQLAAAEPAAVAAAAEVGESRADGWIEQAEEF